MSIPQKIEHTSPFDNLAKSFLVEWFKFNGRLKPIQNSIERGIAFITS
jgi:hypothetical protein